MVPNLKKSLVTPNGTPLNWKAAIKVPRVGTASESTVIGTAVDYAMRAILTRRVGSANTIAHPFIAEEALFSLPKVVEQNYVSLMNTPTGDPLLVKRKLEGLKRAMDRQTDISKYLALRVFEARKIYDDYTQGVASLQELCHHTLLLARLDAVYRAAVPNVIDVYFEEFEDLTFYRRDDAPSDTQLADNVLQLARLFETQITVLPMNKVQCNPTFGRYSRAVGGADADFIMDNTLIDIKTTVKLAYNGKDMAQILGYSAMAQALGQRIDVVGIYYARYGIWALLPLNHLPTGFLAQYLQAILDVAGTQSVGR